MAGEYSQNEVEKDEARKRYEFKKALERLEEKEGSGTELISLYIPPDKQIYDVTAHLRDEYVGIPKTLLWQSKNLNYIVLYGNAATSFVVVWMQANTKIMCWLYSS